jgi:ABC-type polysaccharide/polyol phosphate transport system ATPase subunit
MKTNDNMLLAIEDLNSNQWELQHLLLKYNMAAGDTEFFKECMSVVQNIVEEIKLVKDIFDNDPERVPFLNTRIALIKHVMLQAKDTISTAMELEHETS